MSTRTEIPADEPMMMMTRVYDPPRALVWEAPTSVTTVAPEELGDKTRYTMTARFSSMADREAAVAMGFTRPIEASNERLTAYLKTMVRA